MGTDMRNGHCAVCEGDEVHQAEVSGQMGLRGPGALLAKHTVFSVLVCAGCGFMQWYVPVDGDRRDWLRRKAPRVQPQPQSPR